MTSSAEVTRTVIDALETLGIHYMLAGSFSSNTWGIPRSTKDADFVVILKGDQLNRLIGLLGPRFELDPQPSFETVTGTFREKIHVPSVPFEIELFHLGNDAHDQTRFQRRKRATDELLGREFEVATAEDVIIMKLRWAKIAKRGKDREDVRDVIAVQGDEMLDWDYIHHWTAQHDTRDLLDEIRASIPPLD
jgi:hypothetical protein